ncbi:MAG: response regulator, partial [Pyrinomonadaceae bacterium]|nr:response regulator [Pyrinomonadaceae bacterium]
AIEVIERNAKSQAQLIEDLLDITRITSGKFRLDVKAVEVGPLIENSLETIRPSIQAKEIVLHTILNSSKDLISGDVDRLQQVIWNLLTNAVKFTPKGGRIEVRLEKIGSYLEIYVIDTGKGIEPEFIPFVFDRFRQQSGTMRKHGGLGIGLSIVRHIAELHGGSVRVESEGENKGATFIVRLPLRAITEVQKTPSGENEKIVPAVGFSDPVPLSVNLNGIKIVVVDDEPDARELLSSLLTVYGAEVTTCGSVSEALDTVPNVKPNLLISDIGMPRQDGYLLIKKLRELEPENGGQIPAIALTAYTRVEDRVRALSQGFQLFVAKPVEPSELVAAVRSLTNLSENLTAQNGHNHDENEDNQHNPEGNDDNKIG